LARPTDEGRTLGEDITALHLGDLVGVEAGIIAGFANLVHLDLLLNIRLYRK
jgi:hypothetical protein